jgi:photosystem II stability/assembly factor-like uncharacterized protein
VLVVLVVAAIGASACGGSAPTLSGFTPRDNGSTTKAAASTTTVAANEDTTTTAKAVSEPWVPAAGNLAGLKSECGNLSSVSARPDRDMVIASVAQQGLWATADGADAWTQLGQGGSSAKITNRGSAIVFDPDHPDTFWQSGIYNGNGVYRTDDNGRSFRQLGDVPSSDGVSVDLTDPARRTLLSGTHERTMLFRSTDGGSTWTDVAGGLPSDVGATNAPHVIDAETYLVGTNGATGSGIFRTTDGGTTWTRVLQADMGNMPLVAKSDGAIYWVLRSGGLVKSTDAGLTWTPVTRSGTIAHDATSIVELPSGRFAAIGRQQVIISDDQGATWRSTGPTIPYPPVGLAYSPFRKAFYVWHFSCDHSGDNPIAPDQIMSLSFNDATA